MKVLMFGLLFAFVAFTQSQEPTPGEETTVAAIEGSACKTHFTYSFFSCFSVAILTLCIPSGVLEGPQIKVSFLLKQ